MMRPARRAPLLVGFYLLTSAATVHAECAWVMWWSGTSVATWGIQEAHPTLSECDHALESAKKNLKQAGYDIAPLLQLCAPHGLPLVKAEGPQMARCGSVDQGVDDWEG